jgi:hypothetical protein
MLIVVFVHRLQSSYPRIGLPNLLLIVICLLLTFLVVHFAPVLILVLLLILFPTPLFIIILIILVP